MIAGTDVMIDSKSCSDRTFACRKPLGDLRTNPPLARKLTFAIRYDDFEA